MEGMEENIITYVMIGPPHPEIPLWTAMLNSIITSGILSMSIFAIMDGREDPMPFYVQLTTFVFTFIGIVIAFVGDTRVVMSPGLSRFTVCLIFTYSLILF